MEIQGELLEERDNIKKKNRISLEKDSIQYNAQELEQEQKVDVNPVQLNTQNLHVHLSNNSSGKITGNTSLEENKEIVGNVNIILYFGYDRKYPVYKTTSDNNGNFNIDDLPPGYYTLVGKFENLKYESHYIKVFAGQSTYQSVLLK